MASKATRIELPVERTEIRTGEVCRLVLNLETEKGAGRMLESQARCGWITPINCLEIAIGRNGDFREIVHIARRRAGLHR
jgi:hypothetical protein